MELVTKLQLICERTVKDNQTSEKLKAIRLVQDPNENLIVWEYSTSSAYHAFSQAVSQHGFEVNKWVTHKNHHLFYLTLEEYAKLVKQRQDYIAACQVFLTNASGKPT